MAWKRLRRDPAAIVAMVVLALLVAAVALAPLLSVASPYDGDLALRRQPPSAAHLFGLDAAGRDLLARVLYGGRSTMLAALFATALGIVIGGGLGLYAGFFRGRVDDLLSGLMDLMFAFPFFLLAVLIVAVMGPGLLNAAVAVAVTNVPQYFRLVRSLTLGAAGSEYILAARAIGSRDGRMLLRHILPNILAPVLVVGTVQLANATLAIAGLGFIGLGAQPPRPEWGLMLSEGRSYLFDSPHLMLFPGLALVLFATAANLAGDGLGQLDPRLKL